MLLLLLFLLQVTLAGTFTFRIVNPLKRTLDTGGAPRFSTPVAVLVGYRKESLCPVISSGSPTVYSPHRGPLGECVQAECRDRI